MGKSLVKEVSYVCKLIYPAKLRVLFRHEHNPKIILAVAYK